jgi:hypothetical protein
VTGGGEALFKKKCPKIIAAFSEISAFLRAFSEKAQTG